MQSSLKSVTVWASLVEGKLSDTKRGIPGSDELAMFACLRYEEATLTFVDDYKERWDINDEERQVVLKWMKNRMADISSRL